MIERYRFLNLFWQTIHPLSLNNKCLYLEHGKTLEPPSAICAAEREGFAQGATRPMAR